MGRYVPHSQEEKREMLAFLGLSSEEELFRDVPPEALLHNLNLPEGLSELEVSRTLTEKARRNQPAPRFHYGSVDIDIDPGCIIHVQAGYC